MHVRKSRLLHWHKLDNSAKIFPMMKTERNQNMFRITFVLSKVIDENILKDALDLTLKRFPSFKVKIKRGIFWYYLEENIAELKIFPADSSGITPLKEKELNYYCFKVSYFENNIYIDFYHVLSDGKGALEFFKCLIFYYLKLTGEEVNDEGLVLTNDIPIDPDETIDGFNKYAKKIKIKDLKIKEMQGKKAFLLRGPLFKEGCGLVNIFCDVDKVLLEAKKLNCSLTAFITALFILSIYQSKIKDKNIKSANDIQIFLPINLRTIFPSKTLFNFSLFSRISANVEKDMTIETLVNIIKESIKRDTDKNLLEGKISTTVMGEKFFLMRIAPLPLKQLVFKISNMFIGKAKKTATLSSLGIIKLPKSMEPFVDKIILNANPTDSNPISLTCSTCKNTLSISFANRLADKDIENAFCQQLLNYGIVPSVTSNFWEVQK